MSYDAQSALLEKEIASSPRVPLPGDPGYNPSELPDVDALDYNRKTGKLTYDAAIHLLRSGQSITHQGRIISHERQMPSRMAWADTAEDRKIARQMLENDKRALAQKLEEADKLSQPPSSEQPARDPAWTDEEYAAFRQSGNPPPPATQPINKPHKK